MTPTPVATKPLPPLWKMILVPVAVVAVVTFGWYAHRVVAQGDSQAVRLARQNITINNLSKTVDRLSRSVAALSEQKFAKCRAERNKFEKVLDANANDAYDVLIATLLASRGEVTPAVEAAFHDRLMASERYRAAVTAPDNCKSI